MYNFPKVLRIKKAKWAAAQLVMVVCRFINVVHVISINPHDILEDKQRYETNLTLSHMQEKNTELQKNKKKNTEHCHVFQGVGSL